mgnify:CR=1 FL=1
MSSQKKVCPSFYISSSNKVNKSKSSTTSENIFNWFFKMKDEERIKIFSVANYDICHLIIRMYDKFSISNKTKFKVNLKDKKPIVSQKDNMEDISDNYKCQQKLFLNEIRFYKIKQSNDAMTLSHKLLNDEKLLPFFLNELSKHNFLSEICPVNFDSKLKIYTCSSPKWIKEKEYYNIAEIIIGYFENILNIKYILSKKKNNDMNDAFNNFFKKRNLILDLIKSSSYNENLYDIIDLKKIVSDVINDKTLINDEERRAASKKFLYGLYQPFRMFEPPVEYNVNSYFYKYKEMLMKKDPELLDELIFFSFEGQNPIDLHIKERIVDEFFAYAEKKNIENIVLELSTEGFLTNNTKKPKKRKNKNKKKKNNNVINEETSTKNTENSEKENNIVNENIIIVKKVEDIKENEIKKEDNKEKNEIRINNDNNNKDEEEEKIKIENESVESFNNLSSENSSINNNKVNNIKDDIEKENKNKTFEEINDNVGDSKMDENEINNFNDNSKEIEKENEEHENENNIESNNSINTTQKKKKKKKQKKKNYKLTEEELNNIYINFYNENNNFKNGSQNKIYNSINPIQSTNKNLTKDKNEQLHNLILSFEKKLYKKILSLHEIKYKSIVLLCQKIKDHFKCGLSILIYGSYSTGLELEQSDIDISVELLANNSNGKIKNNLSQKTIPELISELNDYLSNFPEFKNVFPIINTKIPILKMVIVQDNNIETKIDLTFNLRNIKTTVNYYINTIKRYPQIKPLTLLIKQLVKKNKLASVFDGGFSSHSIFIMVASNIRVLLKNQSLLNLGDLLNSFLHFYGKVFNYTNTTIDLMNKNDPYIIKQEYSSVPVFIDPISKINVSKSSYLHENLKKLFSDTYDKLVQGEDNLNRTFEDIFSYT